ncbi:MAG: DUF3078 domain-containing protein [Bacteroidota bacterium]
MSTRTTLLALLLAALLPLTAFAQEEDEPLTEADGWQSSLVGTLAGSQAAYDNWAEGGINSIAFTAQADGLFQRVNGAFLQVHEFRGAFGQVKQDDVDWRKAVDQLRYAFNLQYQGTGDWQPTFVFEARSQFAPGIVFDAAPADFPILLAGQTENVAELKTSDFLSPAYLTQALGVTYDRGAWYRARLGLGLRQTIVAIERLQPVYGNDPGSAVRLEAGVDALLQARRQIAENVLLTSRLSAFYSFSETDAAPDFLWENAIVMKVNDFLNVTLEGALQYDRNFSEDLQLKQVLSVGVSYALIGAE